MSLSSNSLQNNTKAIISITFLFQALTLTFNISYITHLSTEESLENDLSDILNISKNQTHYNYTFDYTIERYGGFAPQKINGIIYVNISIDNKTLTNISIRVDGNLSDSKKTYMPCIIKESVPYFVNFSSGSGIIYRDLCGLPKDEFDCFINLSLEGNISNDTISDGSLRGNIKIKEENCTHLHFKGDVSGEATISSSNETYRLSMFINSSTSKDVFLPALLEHNNKDSYSNKAQLSLEGYPFDISMHWELLLVTILSIFTTALKLSDYKKYADEYKKEKYKKRSDIQKKLIKKIQKIPLIGFIASLIADFHFIPACVIVILGLTAPEAFVSINTLFALVLGALIVNVVSTILIIYEEVLEAKIE